MPFSSSRMISSFFLRSCSQKNLASDKRAAMTFSLPATMVLPPSLAFRLVTSRKWFDSFLPWRSEKHFWCVFIDVVRHSAGTARNDLSNSPMSTVGHSVRPAFSAASASSSTSVRCASLASACAPSLMRRRTRGGIEHDLVLLQLLLVVGEARHLERLVAEEAMAARFLAGLDAGDLERHHLAVEQQHDRMQRADPAQLGAVVELGVEAHRLRPGEIEDRLAQHLVDDLAGGAARLVDARDVEVALLLVLDDLRLVDAT